MSYHDPFLDKVLRRNQATSQLISKFFNKNIPAFHTISLSKLTRFTIISSITLTQNEIMQILNLNPHEQVHNEVYSRLIEVIYNTAKYLFTKTRLIALIEFPITNVEFVSFEIAKKFPELFYVPVEKAYGAEIVLSYKCRFTEMWIITYLLKQEYKKVVEDCE